MDDFFAQKYIRLDFVNVTRILVQNRTSTIWLRIDICSYWFQMNKKICLILGGIPFISYSFKPAVYSMPVQLLLRTISQSFTNKSAIMKIAKDILNSCGERLARNFHRNLDSLTPII